MSKQTSDQPPAKSPSGGPTPNGGSVTVRGGSVPQAAQQGTLHLPPPSRGDFVCFVRTLAERYRLQPDGWENRDLPTYLEALAAWVEDMDGYYQNRGESAPDQPTWSVLRDMLEAARVYE